LALQCGVAIAMLQFITATHRRRDTPLVKSEELPELMAAVPAWTLDTANARLVRKFTAKNFSAGG
jgi:hypothetical protein